MSIDISCLSKIFRIKSKVNLSEKDLIIHISGMFIVIIPILDGFSPQISILKSLIPMVEIFKSYVKLKLSNKYGNLQ